MDNQNMFPWDEPQEGLARNDDPDTSHLAAAGVEATQLMGKIYRVMERYGGEGCVADDVFNALPNIDVQSLSPRFRQMYNRGMIEITGEKRKGSRHNNLQQVRRIMSPPFVIRKKPLTRKRLKLIQVDAEVKHLHNLATRMKRQGVWKDDGVRLMALVKKLQNILETK